MDPRLGLYEGALVVSILGTTTAGLYTYYRRHEPGAKFLGLVLGGTIGWAIVSLLGSLVRGTDLALTSAKLVYLFAPVVVAGILLFVMVYTGREAWLGPKLYAALAVEPILVNVAVWTNDVHGLFWTAVRTDAARIGWDTQWQILFQVHAAYSYILMFVATVWLVRFALRSEMLYQRQVFGLLASLFPPWLGNVLFLTDIVDSDPTPIAFSLTGIVLTWAIVRARFLDITPIARDVVVETITDAVIVIDNEGTVIYHNTATVSLFDRDESLVGEQMTELLEPYDDLAGYYEEVAGARSEASTEVELGGRYYTVEISPLYDVRSEFVGQVFLIHDVTEQKERELELQRRNEQLDRFAGVVSHDLRNPLHVASSQLALARETGADDHFDRVEHAHQRMERLIEDLLTLAKEGEAVAELQSVSLETIARDAWEVAATDGATLEVEGDRALTADPNRLQQLLENLYRNSAEHGGQNVTIRVAPTDDGFVVEDDGEGIPESIREEVLEPGYTTDGSVGIGLMVVSHVAEAHDWDLSIEESPDGGACFRFAGIETVG